MADRSILEARHLVRTDAGAPLLRDVSAALVPGDRLGIEGDSGSGKTVLLRALAALDPLDAGELWWKGSLLDAAIVPSFRREVVYLHQKPAMFPGSVEHNLARAFTLAVNRGRSFDRRRAAELLDRLGRAPGFLERPVRDLSGGEMQIVALVRALLPSPSVLLLDEPTAALDRSTARAAEDLVLEWVTEDPSTRALVWASHDRGQIERIASRRSHVERGEVVTT